MRTKTTGVAKIIANPWHSAKASISVYTRSGTWLADIDEDLLGVEVTNSVDALSGCTLLLRRQYGENDNVPIMSGLFVVGSFVVVYCTVTPADLDYGTEIELFSGRVDAVQWADDPMSVTLTGKAEADMRDTWIENELVYGFCQGTYATRGARVWSAALAASSLGADELCVPSDANRNGHFYRVTTAGTPGTTEPTWPTSSGGTVADGTVTWTESGATSDTLGLDVEDLIQQLLNDNGLSAYTLSVPSSPGWQVKPYLQSTDYVWNAAKGIVDQFGWTLRWAWTGSAWNLLLSEPTRTGGSSVRTFTHEDQRELSDVASEVFDIRNVVRAVYSDSSDRDPDGIPKRKTYEASDATSIATYGRRFMRLAESDTSAIDSAAEAQTLVNSCLSDLKNAAISVVFRTGIDPYLELGDLVTVPADNQHWATAQTLALIEVNHSISSSGASTSLRFYGTPVSQRRGWHRMDARGRQTSEEPTSLATGGTFTLTATNVVGGTRLDINSGNLLKDSLARAFEIHVSLTSGFTPSTSTLKQSGVLSTCILGDLIPGRTYYAKAVPYSYVSGGRVVRGEASSQVSFVAARATSVYYDSVATQSHLPLNGNFEHATFDISTYPPDHWTVEALSGETEQWGSSGSVWYGTDTDKGRYIRLMASASMRGRIISSPFEVRRSSSAYTIDFSCRYNTAVNDLYIDIFGFSDSGLTNQVINWSIVYASGSAGSWQQVQLAFNDYGGFPNNVNFVQVVFRRGTAGSSGWSLDIGDVYVYDSGMYKPVFTQPSWIAPTLTTGWANYGGGWQSAGYMKDSMGFVHLRGLVVRSSGSATTIFTLPSGYRPSAGIMFPANLSNVFGRVDIASTGIVSFSLGDPVSFLSLDGITFDTR